MIEETSTARVRRARRIDRALAAEYPDARCELDFRNPFELLVATVLSAQTTDVRVNSVTPELFARYPDATALAVADLPALEALLHPLGFFRTKAAALLGLAGILVERYAAEVPGRYDDLIGLPGVGRKTANVVLGNAFGIPSITVDTHVGRLARRLGFTTARDPLPVETDLDALFARADRTMVSHRLIFHGRRVCQARRPDCGNCVVSQWCPSAFTDAVA